jgi:hypothetical protein
MYVQEYELPNPITHPHLALVTQSYIVDHRYLVYLSRPSIKRNDVVVICTHLRIRYRDRKLKDIPYSELFAIKNSLFGKEIEAIMVFPKESDHIDNSHTYHLFCWDGMNVPNLKKMYTYQSAGVDKGTVNIIDDTNLKLRHPGLLVENRLREAISKMKETKSTLDFWIGDCKECNNQIHLSDNLPQCQYCFQTIKEGESCTSDLCTGKIR